MLTLTDRADVVVDAARAWLGTPFHHAAKVHGAGVDCAQLLIACYCDTGVVAAVAPEFYAPDWFRHFGANLLEKWVSARCVQLRSLTVAERGDILLFRYGRAASHAAILIGLDAVIHAYRARGVIEESVAMGTPLRARFASAWRPDPWCAL